MSSIINRPEELVQQAIDGMLLASPHLARLDGYPDVSQTLQHIRLFPRHRHTRKAACLSLCSPLVAMQIKVVVNKHADKSKVALISGRKHRTMAAQHDPSPTLRSGAAQSEWRGVLLQVVAAGTSPLTLGTWARVC